MGARRARARALVAAVVVALPLAAAVMGGSTAGATIDGGCTATATFLFGVGTGSITVDAGVARPDEAVVIAPTDTIEWRVTVPGPTTPQPMRGRVEIDLPWPLGTQTIESWAGTATQGEATGLYTYELTRAFPRGVDFTVLASHGEPNVTCTGEVALQVSGGPFDSWLIWVALGGLAISGIALLLAGRARWVQVA